MSPALLWISVLLCLLVSVTGSSETELIVKEEADVILTCSFGDKDIKDQIFDWKKDGSLEVFHYDGGRYYGDGLSGQHEQFKGRVSHFPDQLQVGSASIVINKTKQADSGRYTCDFLYPPPVETRAVVQLVVVVTVIVYEGSDAILPCSPSTKENLDNQLFEWKKDGQKNVFRYDAGRFYGNGFSDQDQDEEFRGRVSFFPDRLQFGKASIIIRNTKTVDSGEYTCHFPNLQPPGQKYITQLVVAGAASQPVVTLDTGDDGLLLLRCAVQGAFPKPEVVFRDSSGNILPAEPQITERGGRYDIILQTTVTKTDDYRCVGTQKEIGFHIYTETHVDVPSV